MNITSQEYWKEIKGLAVDIVQEARDDNPEADHDELQELVYDRLHETIDGHRWAIYYAYNLDVIQHSDNPDYMIDNLGDDSAGEVLKDKGIDGLHTSIAYWAMYGDLSEALNEVSEPVRSGANE